MGVIRYMYGPGRVPGEGRAPQGDWIRLIPFALGFPRDVESVRGERDGFVFLDQVYDLKLIGDADLLGSGPNLLVSDDFARAYRAGGFTGLELVQVSHATPCALRVRPVWSCRPTHHATAVSDRVTLVPPVHPKGLPYGYHGRPTEPLEILAPRIDARAAFGAPWFATASLPFQPLVVPSTFLASFLETVGREPAIGWADVRIVEDPRHALLPRTERFGATIGPPVPGYATFRQALDAARREASTRSHVLVKGRSRPKLVPPAVWSELGQVAGSVFFRGAFGLFPASEKERAAMDPARIAARNVPEYSVLADPLTHSSSVEIGYPLEPDWIPIGWFAGEMPSLIAVTPSAEVHRCEANGERNLHYPSFADFFADVMADLVWAHERDLYGWQWFGA